MSSSMTKVLWESRSCILGQPIGFNKYILTPKNLIIQKGLLHTSCEYINLVDIVNVSISFSLWERLFGVGSVTITSRDIKEKLCVLTKVPNPCKIGSYLEAEVSRVKELKLRRSCTFYNSESYDIDSEDRIKRYGNRDVSSHDMLDDASRNYAKHLEDLDRNY